MNTIGVVIVIIALIITISVRRSTRSESKRSFLEDKVHGNLKYNLMTISYFLVGLVIFQIYLGATSESAGPGTVNLFPEGASSKNYRVDASLNQSYNYLSLFVKAPLNLTEVQWPDSGTEDVDACIVPREGSTTCVIGEDTYRIELEDYEPASSNPDDN